MISKASLQNLRCKTKSGQGMRFSCSNLITPCCRLEKRFNENSEFQSIVKKFLLWSVGKYMNKLRVTVLFNNNRSLSCN